EFTGEFFAGFTFGERGWRAFIDAHAPRPVVTVFEPACIVCWHRRALAPMELDGCVFLCGRGGIRNKEDSKRQCRQDECPCDSHAYSLTSFRSLQRGPQVWCPIGVAPAWPCCQQSPRHARIHHMALAI